MVASLLRLRLVGLANRIVRPRVPAERVALGVGVLLLALAAVALVLFARDVTATTPELRNAGFITVGSLLIAAYWFVPFGLKVDDGFGPNAFRWFAIRPRRLAAGLAVAAIASLPSVLLVALDIVFVVAWARSGPGPAVLALFAGLIMLATAVLGGLVASALARSGIVARNAAGLVILALVAIAAPLAALLVVIDWAAVGVTQLRRVAAVLEWTPFGAGWAVPGELALGRWGEALAQLLIALVIAAALWFAWEAIVARATTRPDPQITEKERVGLALFDALPDNQTGVIAARSLTYWLRDPRYAVPLLILPVVPAVIVVAFALAGVPWSAIIWIPVPVVCLLIGWVVHNDVAADGTAFWLHVVASVRGRPDRWGRVIAPLIIGVPVAVVGGIVSAMLYGHLSVALPLIALSICALGAALGVGSVASAVAPYPTAHPGDGPFAQPQGASAGEGAKQATSLLISAACCLPVVGLVTGGVLGLHQSFLAATITGFLLGPTLLIVGIELGALALRRRSPELLAFTQQN